MDNIRITWLGHACFVIEADSYRILVDPYAEGSVPGVELAPQEVNEVLCSHEHFDHNNRACAKLITGVQNPFEIEVIDSFHDDENGKKRGTNKIHVFKAHGLKAVHFGDIGCDLTDEQKAILSDADAAMIPVGGTYTVTARKANEIVNEIKPRIVIPMHYRSDEFGFGNIGHLSEFTDLRSDVIYSDKNYIDIGDKTVHGCVVLKYTHI